MDWNAVKEAGERIFTAETNEEAMEAVQEVSEALVQLAMQLHGLEMDDIHAVGQKELKKAINKTKVLQTPPDAASQTRVVQLTGWSFEGVSYAVSQGRILTRCLPHSKAPTEQDLRELYGLPEALLNDVKLRIEGVVFGLRGRPVSHLHFKILLTLYWLRNNPTLVKLGMTFGVAKNYAWKTLRRMLAYFRVALDDLIPKSHQWRDVVCSKEIMNHLGQKVTAIGSLDGTAMYRRENRLGKTLLWRGDRDRPALTTQILSDFEDKVVDVVVTYGHNSDGGIAGFSGMKEKLEQHGLAVLVDSGYDASEYFVTPESGSHKTTMKTTYNDAHGHVRSGVERVNSWIKNWRVVSNCRVSIAMQSTSIIIACALYNLLRTYTPLNWTPWVNEALVSALLDVGPMVVRDVPRKDAIAAKMLKQYYEKKMEEANRDLERSVALMEGEREPEE